MVLTLERVFWQWLWSNIILSWYSDGVLGLEQLGPETIQLTYLSKLLAGYIQYKYIFRNIYICIQIWGIHVSCIYILPISLVLYISYQQLGEMFHLEGFCAPRNVHFVIYIFVLDICCQHVIWRVSVRPSGACNLAAFISIISNHTYLK